MEFPKTDFDIALEMVVKTINDTMGPDVIVPSLLLFRELKRTCPQLDSAVNLHQQNTATLKK